MPLIDISNPKTIRFLNECYEKEYKLRVNWVTKNEKQIRDAGTFKKEPKNNYDVDVIVETMAGGMAAMTRDHVASGYNRKRVPIRDGTFIPGVKNLRHGHSIVDVGLSDPKDDPRLQRPDSDMTLDPVMRPVDPKLKDIIYEPLPGRHLYLGTRNDILPEKRYYFPECSNWDYGWRLKDSKASQRASYGRVWRLARALRNRVGHQPDSEHYKQAISVAYSKCE